LLTFIRGNIPIAGEKLIQRIKRMVNRQTLVIKNGSGTGTKCKLDIKK
jgi:2-phospho-L-lactate guanylyltransferase (CobY/MobA/RfbA family)